jgi:DNA-binding response OmpR family regulator
MTTKVLVVEDDKVIARWMHHAFTRNAELLYPYSVVSAPTLKDALRTLREEVFDLVLLDLGLPDSREHETFHRIYACAPHTPIIITTANDDVALAIELLKCGAYDYIVKPFADTSTFQLRVRLALRRYYLLTELRNCIENLKRNAPTIGWSPAEQDNAAQSLFAAELVATALPHLWQQNQAAAQNAMQELEHIITDTLVQLNKMLLGKIVSTP